MKVLLDQNVADNLRSYLSHHDVSVSYLMGWGRLTNGNLLAAAEQAGFEVFITGDKNLQYQQNLSRRKIAIVVITRTNWPQVSLHAKAIVDAVDACRPGDFRVVECAPA